jgi:hypothetical protein
MSVAMGSPVSHQKSLALAVYRRYEGPETVQAGVAAAKCALAEYGEKNP